MGKRNSQLQELLTVAENDYLTIVDTSAGQSKRVSVKTLVGIPDLGWTAAGETWTFSSWNGTTFLGVMTVPSNATTKYSPGMRVKITQTTGGTKMGTIQTLSATTLTVLFDAGFTLNNETITNPNFSIAALPYGQNFIQPGQLGDTGWISPTFAANYVGSSLQYRKIGNIVYIRGQATRTSGVPTSGDIPFTLPAGIRPASSFILNGAGTSQNYGKWELQAAGSASIASSWSGGAYAALTVAYPAD